MSGFIELSKVSLELRKDVVSLITSARTGHIGGDLSVMDILVTLYFKHMNIDPCKPDDPNRDRLILSKGHCVEALYMVLCERGFLDKQDVFSRYCKFDSPYIGHPNNKLPGIETNSGSLGHGLSVGVGMAIAGMADNRDYRVYVVMGDGELAEGSVWEAAMAASSFRLNNLIAIIDRNRLQISGYTEEVMPIEPLVAKWEAFGWNCLECNGNSIQSLDCALTDARNSIGKPSIIIANTTKGFGSSLISNKAEWHHKIPTESEKDQILQDLDDKIGRLQ